MCNALGAQIKVVPSHYGFMKIMNVLFFKHCKWTVIANRQKKQAKLSILSHK